MMAHFYNFVIFIMSFWYFIVQMFSNWEKVVPDMDRQIVCDLWPI